MAKKWTAERNERLLLLTVKDLKVDANKLAKAWGDQYGNDEFQPTARAITEQFAVLKKKATGGKGGAMKASTVPSTPKTPRTTTKSASKKTTKTPTSITPSKRKHASQSDDEEASSEDDSETMDLKNLPRAVSRASLSRSKKVPRRYADPGSDVEKADDESDSVPFKAESQADVGAMGDGEEIHVAGPVKKGIDSVMGELMAEAAPKGKQAFSGKKAAEWEDNSDDSDFAASFG